MIEFRDVYKSYGDTLALKGISLHIQPSEVFGLLGPNGAGKTTAVHLLAGILSPDRGSIWANGEQIAPGSKMLKKIGIAPQALSLYEDLTARDNLVFFARLFGLTGKIVQQRVDDALRFVRLSELAGKRVKKFSGGMKRRLNLAAALVNDPEILILDEPTVGVDPQSRNAIFENILALKRQGKTILYTTHYMEEAQRLCDRVAIVDRGELKALGTADELIRLFGDEAVLVVETKRGIQTFATHDPLQALQEIQKKETILHFRLDRPNLENVFLKITGRSLRDAT